MIAPALDFGVCDFIAVCIRHGIDFDYTKALNLLAELQQN